MSPIATSASVHLSNMAFSSRNSGIAASIAIGSTTANKLSRIDASPTFVMVGPTGDRIGFPRDQRARVDDRDLRDRFARDRPGHGIPVACIAMIGVDRRFQGRGHRGAMLIDCLLRLAGAADPFGVAVVMLDVLDRGEADAVAKRLALHVDYGFALLPSHPLRLFMPMGTVRQLTTT